MSSNRIGGLSITAFILGLVSLFLMLGIITAVPGIIIGHVARSRAINYPNQYRGSRLAILGLVMSYTSIVLLVLLVVVGNHLHVNGNLIPLLDTLDTSKTMSTYAKDFFDAFPFIGN